MLYAEEMEWTTACVEHRKGMLSVGWAGRGGWTDCVAASTMASTEQRNSIKNILGRLERKSFFTNTLSCYLLVKPAL